ncbi:17483_t:CDS:2, partial [Gigaspora rosea]
KEEQEIIGILGEYKNRTLKKDNAIAEYLGIQHVELVCVIRETIQVYDYIQHKIVREQQVSAKEMGLLEINKNQNQPNKVVNQLSTEKAMLLQLECATLQTKLETRELQEEIVRIDGTTHLIEKESSTDTVMSDKEEEEIRPIIGSLSTKMDSSTHIKAREDIAASIWAPQNREKEMRENNRSDLHPTIEESDLPSNLTKQIMVKVVFTINKRTQSSYMAQSTLSAPVQSKTTRERSSQHKQSRHEQQTSEEHSTSPFQTSEQLLASCDNSAANIKRENTFTASKIGNNKKSAIVNAIQNKENINLKIGCHNINGVKANSQKLDL